MSFKYAFTEYPVAGVSKLLATNGGAHIYNVTLSTEAWNGAIVKRGNWNSFDNYAEDTATTFNGIVRGQAANGNWYIEVLADLGFDALIVYNPPVVEAEWGTMASAEKHFYLKAGEVARAHELKRGDIFEVSANACSGADLEEGATISTISNKKLVVVAKA